MESHESVLFENDSIDWVFVESFHLHHQATTLIVIFYLVLIFDRYIYYILPSFTSIGVIS